MIEWTKQIPGAPDAELGLPRKTPITYHCTSKENSAKGLIFVIHGFGDDANSAYDKLLRRYIAETAGLLVVTVEYHCYQARPSSGALRQLPPETYERLGFLTAKYGIQFDPGNGNVLPVLRELGNKLEETLYLKGILIPANGDYQNFGVLQAMDHLAALNDIIDTGFAFEQNRIFLIGGSHGGYIAHLLARLAPNSVLGLIDNSSYTLADYKFLGQASEYFEEVGKLMLAFSVITEWQFSGARNPAYYSPSRAIFRDTACLSLLAASAKASDRKAQYLMFNTVDDLVSPIVRKRMQLRNLQRAGFSASLREITADDIGEELFKSMQHADAPMQKLFAHSYKQFEDRSTVLDRYRGTAISFDCGDKIYTIVHGDKPPYAELRVEDNPDY